MCPPRWVAHLVPQLYNIGEVVRCQLDDAVAALGEPGEAVICSLEGATAAWVQVTDTLDGHASPGPLRFTGGRSGSGLW